MRRLMAVVGCVALLAVGAEADVLLDQLWVVDDGFANQAVVGNLVGGEAMMGEPYDLQVVDDFTVGEPGFVITDLTVDYVTLFGGGATLGLVEVFEDVGGVPGEDAIYSEVVGTTYTAKPNIVSFFPGERQRASGLSIELGAGHYWIGMQMITLGSLGGTGGLYYSIQYGVEGGGGATYMREPGIDPDLYHGGEHGFDSLAGGQNVPDFELLDLGDGPGDTPFKVEGHVPANIESLTAWVACMSGPDMTCGGGCQWADMDSDGDVDMDDYQDFAAVWTDVN